MQRKPQHAYEFGPYRLDTAERQLYREGQRLQLTPKAFETLVVLVERRGRLVEKDELMKAVWPDSFVEEANLTNNIYVLRQTLADGPSYIETVPKRGYRFTAGVRDLKAAEDLVLEKHTFTRTFTEEEEEVEDNHLTAVTALPVRNPSGAWAKLRIAAFASALILALVAGATVFLRARRNREEGKAQAVATNQQLNSIAVLPFKAIGSEKENEYLSLGLADALITRLGNVRQIMVRPTSAVRHYTNNDHDLIAVGREQGVDAVLDGNFQRADDHLRLTVQLIRVADGATLWSAQFDEKFTDIFSVQDAISEQVACDLVTRVCGKGNEQLAKQQQIKIEAYEAYLKGRYFWNKRNIEGARKAAEYFQQAIDLEPNYALAYAGLADTVVLGGGDRRSLAQGKAAVLKAIEIDETLAEAHATLGLFAMNSDWDWAQAEREFKRAIELNPNYPTARQRYGEFLAYMGRFDEAVTEIKRAHELDPMSLIITSDLGKVYTMARRYDEAIKQYETALDVEPEFTEANVLLAITCSLKGDHERAASQLLKVKELENTPAYLSFAVYVYTAAGRKGEAQQSWNRLKVLLRQSDVSPLWMATAYAGRGEKDEAFKWFDRVFEEHSAPGVISLKVNPVWDGLRSDRRFRLLLQRSNLPI